MFSEDPSIEDIVETKRQPTTNPIMKFFEYQHSLGPEKEIDVVNVYADLAMTMDEWLPDGPEKSVALRKLLESKDAALRCVIT